MTKYSFRSLTVPFVLSLTLISSTFADQSGTYGDAPPSLDFPADSLSGADARRAARLTYRDEWIRDERFFLSPTDPFPSKNVAAIDPITKKKVERVLVGPAFMSRAYGSDYNYYRYVTFFDVRVRKEQIFELPVHRSQCWDHSDLFSNYVYSNSYTASVTASASFEGIGLSATFSRTRTFSSGRGVSSQGGVVADYTPYALKHDWVGRTFIQLYDSKTGAMKFLDTPKAGSPWWVYLYFPILAKQSYPMAFRVKDASWTFVVEKTIIENCEGSFGAR